MGQLVHPGRVLDLTAPSGGVISGTFYKINAILCLAMNTIAQGNPFPAQVEGVIDYTSDTGTVWAEGDAVYWDDTAKKFTKTSSGNTLAGYCVAGKASGGVVGRIKLTPKAA